MIVLLGSSRSFTSSFDSLLSDSEDDSEMLLKLSSNGLTVLILAFSLLSCSIGKIVYPAF